MSARPLARRPRFLCTGILLAAIGATTAARAQPAGRDPAAAEVLFDRGRTAAARGDWAQACASFEQSMALDPATGTLLNLGECRYHVGKLAEAWQDFVEALRELPADDARRAYAKGRLDELDKRVARLVVSLAPGAPPETRVQKNGTEMPPATLGIALPVNPGSVVVAATAPGRSESRIELTLKEGESKRIEIAPGGSADHPSAAPPKAVGPSPLAPDASPAGGMSWRTVGFTIGGVGVAGLAIGAVTGVVALVKAGASRGDCPSNACADSAHLQAAQNDSQAAHSLSTASTAAFVVGAAAAGVGLYFLVKGGPAPSSVGLAPAPGGGAVGWSGNF
jgi:hypothetical protein